MFLYNKDIEEQNEPQNRNTTFLIQRIPQTTIKVKGEKKMTNTNMKSKVCTLANSFIRNGMGRSAAFTKAWATVKAQKNEIGYVAPADLNVGDTIKANTTWERNVDKVIASIAPAGSYAGIVVRFVGGEGQVFNDYTFVQRVAAA